MDFETEIAAFLKQARIRKAGSDQVSVKFPRAIIHGLQWVSVGYSSALYFAGKKIGKEIIASQAPGADVKGILEGVVSLFAELGIGTLEIKEASPERAVLQLREGASSFGMQPIGKPVCFFEAGLIAGILEGRLPDKKVSVNETLCGGLGDEVDEFVVRFG